MQFFNKKSFLVWTFCRFENLSICLKFIFSENQKIRFKNVNKVIFKNYVGTTPSDHKLILTFLPMSGWIVSLKKSITAEVDARELNSLRSPLK